MASAPVSSLVSFDGGLFTTCKQNKPFFLQGLLVPAFITTTKSKEGWELVSEHGLLLGRPCWKDFGAVGKAVGCSELNELSEESQQAAVFWGLCFSSCLWGPALSF